MIFDLHNPYEVKKFNEWASRMVEQGKAVECRQKFAQRSLSQNSYLHVLLAFFASEFGNSVEEVKQDIFKRQVNAAIFERERENKRGKVVKYLRSTSAEMTLAIDRFCNWSASECGFPLPAPNEERFLLYAMKQAEEFEQYK